MVTKKTINCTITEQEEQQLEESEFVYRCKELIRVCDFANYSTSAALEFLNNGMLGFEVDKKTGKPLKNEKDKPIPVTISRRTYFIYKKQINKPSEISELLIDFSKRTYVLELVAIKTMVKQMLAKTVENTATINDPVKNQRIIDNFFKHAPAYTQFLDILHKMIKYGKFDYAPLAKKLEDLK